MTARFVYLGICGIILAGIVHIAAILMIPALGSKDAARQIIRSSPELVFTKINNGSSIKLAAADPFFELAVCKFSLDEDGIIVSGDLTSIFWSASVYDARGQVLYSLNDRTAIANKLQLLIVNPVQMAAIRQLQPDELETSIVVETSEQDGFVLLRTLVQDLGAVTEAKTFMSSAKCELYKPLSEQ